MTMSAGAGAVWGAVIQAMQGRRDMMYNKSEAERNRRYQRWMYERQYQMTVGDLRAAGLNPMLAYGNSPNAVPQGAMASAPGGASIVGSAVEAAKLDSEVKKLQAEIANLGAQYGLNSTQMIKLNQEITTEVQRVKLVQAQGNLVNTEAELNQMTINVIKRLEKSLGKVTQEQGFSQGLAEIFKLYIMKR
jgi:hypothetical protein